MIQALDYANRIRGLYVLTDRSTSGGRSHVDICRAAVVGGASLVQLRAKDMEAADAVAVAKEMAGICKAASVAFLVNDRVDIAMASGADGVHLGPGDMEPADARRLMGPEAIIGASVASVAEGRAAEPFASYFGVGAVFGTTTKGDAGAAIGTARLVELKCAYPGMPIVAIGGINASNIHFVRETGVEAAAVISAVTGADDMASATRALVDAFRG
ncbi:MAG TPA: thiamine phosphate synthase [Capsulimonadaceae bacterium]|jgi:thiamine-phosphate pyrophosphorylase